MSGFIKEYPGTFGIILLFVVTLIFFAGYLTATRVEENYVMAGHYEVVHIEKDDVRCTKLIFKDRMIRFKCDVKPLDK